MYLPTLCCLTIFLYLAKKYQYTIPKLVLLFSYAFTLIYPDYILIFSTTPQSSSHKSCNMFYQTADPHYSDNNPI